MGRVSVGSVSRRQLESVYREHFMRLVRVATAITRDEAAGAEAVQEAFVRLLRARRGYRGDGAVEGWVWRTVVNEAKRRVVRERERRGVAEDEIVDEPQDADQALRALVASLPERQRLAVFLRYYADLDYRTIATVLGVEIGTVSATLASAHRSLRAAMEGAVR
jgi:RNA polymerase sigma factor (sigma-70 family)